MISNCGYFDQKPFAQEMQDHCRAGGNALAIDLHKGSVADVVNCTIAGQGDALVEIECREGSDCSSSEWVRLQNNVFAGYGDFLSSGDETAFLWDPSNFSDGRIDYNVMYHLKYGGQECPFGAHDLCADPLFTDSSLDSFDGRLREGSPAIDSGLPVGSLSGLVPDHDIRGISRPQSSGADRGVYEFTDQSVNLGNAVRILRICAGTLPAITDDLDFDENGKMGLEDVIYILQVLSGLRK
jgi:hypothetical protein